MPTTTTNRKWPAPIGSDPDNVPSDLQALANALDNVADLYYGPVANRPASTVQAPGSKWRMWWDTTNGVLALDTGTGWVDIGPSVIADGKVTNAKLATDAVTQAKMADNSVGTAELIAKSVTAAKIADNTITSAQMASGAVDSVRLADGAVSGAKLASLLNYSGRINFSGTTADEVKQTNQVGGDNFSRFLQRTDGSMSWGDGNVTQDVHLKRKAAAILGTDGWFDASAFSTKTFGALTNSSNGKILRKAIEQPPVGGGLNLPGSADRYPGMEFDFLPTSGFTDTVWRVRWDDDYNVWRMVDGDYFSIYEGQHGPAGAGASAINQWINVPTRFPRGQWKAKMTGYAYFDTANLQIQLRFRWRNNNASAGNDRDIAYTEIARISATHQGYQSFDVENIEIGSQPLIDAAPANPAQAAVDLYRITGGSGSAKVNFQIKMKPTYLWG